MEHSLWEQTSEKMLGVLAYIANQITLKGFLRKDFFGAFWESSRYLNWLFGNA